MTLSVKAHGFKPIRKQRDKNINLRAIKTKIVMRSFVRGSRMRIRIKRHASPSYRIFRTQLQKEVYFVIVIPYILLLVLYSVLQCSCILPTQKPIRQGEIKIDRYTGERENRKIRTNRKRESMKISLFRHGALTQLSLLLLLFLAGCVRRSLGDEENCVNPVEFVRFAYTTECSNDNYGDMCSDTGGQYDLQSSCICQNDGNDVVNLNAPTYYTCTTNGCDGSGPGQCVQ